MPQIFILLISAILWFALPLYAAFAHPLWMDVSFTTIATALVFFIGIVGLMKVIVLYLTCEYVITNQRVIIKNGLINIHVTEVLLQKIETIYVNQSLFGKLLDFGTVVIVGSGGTKDIYPNVPNPFLFRKLIQENIEKVKDKT